MKQLILGITATISSMAMAQEKVEIKKVDGVRTVYTDIVIDASPEQVWQVLTDTRSYPNWAKFMVSITGEVNDSAQITVDFLVNEKKNKINTVEHMISAVPGERFSWSDVFMMGMKDHHVFRVEATSDGKTRFIQSDEVRGRWSWLMGNSLMKFEAKNYPIFNRSLKAEVERRFPS